jgi:hypothetical protein
LKEAALSTACPRLRRLFEIVYQTKLAILHNANVQLALEVMLISLIEVYNDRNHLALNFGHREIYNFLTNNLDVDIGIIVSLRPNEDYGFGKS